MKAIVLTLALLMAAPAFAAEDEARIPLKAGTAFVAPVDGAFISRDEAIRLEAAFKREQTRATRCLDECSSAYPFGTVVVVAVAAFAAGAAALGGYQLYRAATK